MVCGDSLHGVIQAGRPFSPPHGGRGGTTAKPKGVPVQYGWAGGLIRLGEWGKDLGPITGELCFGAGASKLELGRDSESEAPLLGYPSQALREAATEVASLTSGFKG